jgi:hypothetical protein
MPLHAYLVQRRVVRAVRQNDLPTAVRHDKPPLFSSSRFGL